MVILPDSVRNYMSKFLNDDWMKERDFLEESVGFCPVSFFAHFPRQKDDFSNATTWWGKKYLSDIELATPITVLPGVTCQEAVNILQSEVRSKRTNGAHLSFFPLQSIDQMPVVNNDNEIVGMVTEGNLMSQLLSKRVNPEDPVSKVIYRCAICCYQILLLLSSKLQLLRRFNSYCVFFSPVSSKKSRWAPRCRSCRAFSKSTTLRWSFSRSACFPAPAHRSRRSSCVLWSRALIC